ncbi:MAG: hypothetical protein Q4B05_01115 [Candidatus Saccharibacteria bacterium]|nr:hypothetical protein [Candidatus Saccharibacteria bacterium]
MESNRDTAPDITNRANTSGNISPEGPTGAATLGVCALTFSMLFGIPAYFNNGRKEMPHTLVTIDDLQCTNPATDESRPAAVERINDRRFDPKFSGTNTNNQLDEVVFNCPEGLILNGEPAPAVQPYTKENWLEHADKPRLHLKGLAPAEAAVRVSIVTDGDGRPVRAVIATPASGSISAARSSTSGN